MARFKQDVFNLGGINRGASKNYGFIKIYIEKYEKMRIFSTSKRDF